MKTTILHNAAVDPDSAAERDMHAQLAAVEHALHCLGHRTARLACSLNLEAVEAVLVRERPELVFNIVESLGGSDRLAHLAAVLLDDSDLPYTGSPAGVLHLTNNKPLAKQRLRAANLPTPDWAIAEYTVTESSDQPLSPPYIIKAIWENASVGLDDYAVITSGDGATVRDQITSRSRQLGFACFAEQYIDGREFNLSLIATPDGPRVLPPAEVDFRDFPPERPKIVSSAAKRGDGAVDFIKPGRIFEFPDSDGPVLDSLRALALDCWHHFRLAGYASLDIRIDEHGRPWILEINANPSLAHEGSFAAALSHGGISHQQAIEWIVANALRPRVQREEVNGQKSEVRYHEPEVVGPTSQHSPTHHSPPNIKLRAKPKRTDAPKIRALVASSTLFRDSEIDSAVELLQAQLKKGTKTTNEFIFAEEKKSVVGYICFGKNPLTTTSFDIHWLAVDPGQQRRGIGHLLLTEAEQQIKNAGGTRIYLNTSLRAEFQATRDFYEHRGYQLAAVLDDFYAPGDSQAKYLKLIEPTTTPAG